MHEDGEIQEATELDENNLWQIYLDEDEDIRRVFRALVPPEGYKAPSINYERMYLARPRPHVIYENLCLTWDEAIDVCVILQDLRDSLKILIKHGCPR